ncbi:hypothetical protein ACRW1A_27085, partial [Escherichia coli]
TLKMPAFEWVHVQLHQQKGMISLSPPTICNSAIMVAAVERGVYWMAGEPCKTASGARVYVTVRSLADALSSFSEKVFLK